MKYSNSKMNPPDDNERPQLIKYCEWENCNNKGIYRAPKNRDNLREFRWFCLKHIREYNKKWDYFSGLSQKEIENEIKKERTRTQLKKQKKLIINLCLSTKLCL